MQTSIKITSSTKFKMATPTTNANTNAKALPSWFSQETGIYNSKFPNRPLPNDPFLDVVSFIFNSQTAYHTKTALIDSTFSSSFTYSQVLTLIKSTASGLNRLGIKQHDVVLLLLPNSVYFPILFLSCVYIGVIVTTMNPLSSVSEIRKQALNCNVCFAFTVKEQGFKLGGLQIPFICVPILEDCSSCLVGFEDFYNLLYRNDADAVDRNRGSIRQDDIAAILYSSGTTGPSKGVLLTHRNFIAMIELFVKFETSLYKDLSSENVYLAALPMFHVYGLSLFAMGVLATGAKVVVMSKFDVNEVGRVIDAYGVTHFHVVPPMLKAFTGIAKGVVCGNDGIRFRSLKQVSCGAAPLSSKIIHDFLETLPHVDFIQGYGLTESTAVGTRGFNTKKFRKYSSVGLLAPNTQAKVVDCVTGSLLPPGCTGELWLRGPGTMQGYLNDREASSLTIDKDHWLHTGDIGYIDFDGYLHIFDRLKEVIKYKGFQIAPADLEAILISHPEICDAAVTAGSDEECGEIPVAFVVRKNGSTTSQTSVIDYVAEQVAPYKKVRKVVFIQSIPKSASGKILRRELRKSLNSRL